MKKIAIIVSAIVIVLVLVVIAIVFYSRTRINKTDDGVTITNNNLVSDDVNYVTGDAEVTIHRNKITRKASVAMRYKIKDQEEYTEMLGQKLTMVPFLVNTTCSMLAKSFFEPEKPGQLSEGEKSNGDVRLDKYLTGYTPTGFKLNFIDAETGENIASCEFNQAGNNNIKFETFRDYSGVNSVFGAKMGVFDESK